MSPLPPLSLHGQSEYAHATDHEIDRDAVVCFLCPGGDADPATTAHTMTKFGPASSAWARDLLIQRWRDPVPAGANEAEFEANLRARQKQVCENAALYLHDRGVPLDGLLALRDRLDPAMARLTGPATGPDATRWNAPDDLDRVLHAYVAGLSTGEIEALWGTEVWTTGQVAVLASLR